jgi:quercetin dioxygenase-like cupin family protein
MTDTMRDAPQAAILRPAEIVPHERGGGARTVPLVTGGIGSTSLLNGITEFAPGGAIPLHTHHCEESVMVLEGEALAEIAGATHRMGVHDTTWVPAEVPHRFVNAGPGRLRIFWTYASVDATRTLVATGETRRIDAERR